MSATGAYTYVKTCYECRADFETWDGEEELCPTCQREYLRETCPEALAEWDDQWAEGVILPDPDPDQARPCDCDDGWIETYPRGVEAYLPTGDARTAWEPCPECNPAAMHEPALILPEACLMGVGELCAYHRSYEVRIAAHLTGVGNGLSRQERAHAYEVGEQYFAWQAAVRWSFERPS